MRIRRKRGARNDPKYVETRHHSGRFSIQFFAAITYGHHTLLIHIPTRPPSERKGKKNRGGMNSEQYCKLAYLGPGGLNSWMGGLPGGKESYEIMEDGNSAHRSAYTAKELGIRKMPWPTRSPDLNLIENVWAMLKKRTKKGFRKRSPQNQREVVEAVQEEWEKLPWKRIYDMIDGMPRRFEAVVNVERSINVW